MSKEEEVYQEFLKKQQAERKAELDRLDKVDPNNIKVVNDSLRDKAVSTEQNFTAKGKKEAGVSAGYVATENETGNTFILKKFHKDANSISLLNQKQVRQANQDRQDGVRELLGAAMYQFLLYDRAPKEQLVEANDKKYLYVRSKFFDNVVALSQFSGAPGTHILDTPKLKQVEGLEKVIAASHILGELDYHGQNVMVQTQKDENGKERNILTKIDHGRSLASFHKDFSTLISKTAKDFRGMDYDKAIRSGNLEFDVEKYSASLKQMVNQFSEGQIDAIVDQKIAELKKAGFDPKGFNVISTFGQLDQATVKPVNSFESLSENYKDLLKQNLSNMRQISEQIEIVAKFTGVDAQFKKGGWLNDIASSGCKDPIEFAIKKNIKIEGKNPIAWAKEKGKKIEGKDPIAWASKKNIKIEGKNPIAWASDNDKKINGKDPIAWAKEKGKKIEGQDPESWLSKTKQKDEEFAKKVLTPIIDSFVKEHVGKKPTEHDAKKFYSSVLQKLHENNYVTNEKIGELDKRGELLKVARELVKLDALELKLTRLDKFNYGVANFCNKIGCTGISKHFMNKISSENLSKINEISNVIGKNLKLGMTIGKSQGERIETKSANIIKSRSDGQPGHSR
jgi:hypothetical protein